MAKTRKQFVPRLLYRIPSVLSMNEDRDKALVAKQLLRNLLTECVFCGREFTPYVDFPQVYRSRSCPTCVQDQRLERCPYDLIPDDLTRTVFVQALDNLYEKDVMYPTYVQIFDEIHKINKKTDTN